MTRWVAPQAFRDHPPRWSFETPYGDLYRSTPRPESPKRKRKKARMAAAKKSRARVTETVRRVVQFKDTGSIMFDAERDGNGDVTIDVDCGDSYTFKFEDLKKVVAALERKP